MKNNVNKIGIATDHDLFVEVFRRINKLEDEISNLNEKVAALEYRAQPDVAQKTIFRAIREYKS